MTVFYNQNHPDIGAIVKVKNDLGIIIGILEFSFSSKKSSKLYHIYSFGTLNVMSLSECELVVKNE